MPKKINFKKASLFSLALVVIGLIILISAVVIMVDKRNKFFDKDGFYTIGSKQYKLFNLYHKGEAALLYVDQAAKYSVSQSLVEQGRNGGHKNTTLCGEYLDYSLWIDGTDIKNCFPDVKESFKEYMQNNLNKRLSSYPETGFPKDNYIFSYSDDSIIGIALEPIQLIEQYVSGIGNPNDQDNQIQKCNSGDCVAELAKYYAKLYESLPYVWGGESPYSYEISMQNQVEQGANSLFNGVSLTKYQPAGSAWSGRLTTPGFDCTGLVWWVLVHSGFGSYYRDSASGLYQQVKRRGDTKICSLDSNSCTKDNIKKNAKPGDIMFIHPCPEKGICHAALYVGNNKLVESIGSEGPIYREIPNEYNPDNEYQIHSIYRPDYSTSYEAPTMEVVEDVFDAPIEPTTSSQYTVRPSFKAKLDFDFDFDVYDMIMGKLNNENGIITRSLVCELQGTKLEDCIKAEISEQNKILLSQVDAPFWELNCERGKEQTFRTFIEGYHTCLQSSDAECVCNFSMDYQTGFENQEYSFILNQHPGYISIGLDDTTLNYSVKSIMLMEAYTADQNIFSRNTNNMKYTVSYKDENFRESELIIDEEKYSEENHVFLFRNSYGYLGFLPITEIKKLNDYPICQHPEQRTFRLCYHTQQKYRVYDAVNQKVDDSEVVIRFAVAFPELTP
jgi:cell wall-associated NlpC family hydrolase